MAFFTLLTVPLVTVLLIFCFKSFIYVKKKYFTAKRAAPPTIPTDDVIPLRFVDALYPISFDFTLVFRDSMDTELLRAAADKVLQREGWRQLGARLRRTVRLDPRAKIG